jgi:predicted nuclease of predicted toxin-antitoxin system
MKCLVDMNLSPGWVDFLIEAGIDSIHWSMVGLSTATDGELMRWAADEGFVILTADLDFGAILAATHAVKPSVVQIRSDRLTPRSIGSAVLRALRQMESELEDGAIVSVDTAGARLRILPMRTNRH